MATRTVFMPYAKKKTNVRVVFDDYNCSAFISSSNFKTKKWGESQLKREASELGIFFRKRRGRYYARDPKKMKEEANNLFLALQKVGAKQKKQVKTLGF